MCRRRFAGGVGAVVPLVAPGVGQSQAAPDEFKPHAAGGARTGRGGVVGVAADEADGLGVAAERDVDEAGARGVDAVLEGVFDQGDEDQRSHVADGARGGRAEVGRHFDAVRQSQAHEPDVAADEAHLALKADGLAAVLVEQVAQHAAELLDGVLRLGGVEGGEGVDVVKGV